MAFTTAFTLIVLAFMALLITPGMAWNITFYADVAHCTSGAAGTVSYSGHDYDAGTAGELLRNSWCAASPGSSWCNAGAHINPLISSFGVTAGSACLWGSVNPAGGCDYGNRDADPATSDYCIDPMPWYAPDAGLCFICADIPIHI